MTRSILRKPVLLTIFPAAVSLGANHAYAQSSSNESASQTDTRVLATTSNECLPGARSIHELTPQLALNDFDGQGQTVAALSYSFSQCMGTGRNRWFIEASAAHVREDVFRADAALVGVGLELRPLRRDPHFVLIPVVRLGRDEYRTGGGATVFNGALTAASSVPLQLQTRRIEGRDISIASSQFEWAVRAEYTSRDLSRSLSAVSRDTDAFTFFGSIALDQAIGQSNWRWKAALSYQTIGGDGPVDGIASLGLSARIVNTAYTNYSWNFAIRGQLGDSGFRALIFAVSMRFGR